MTKAIEQIGNYTLVDYKQLKHYLENLSKESKTQVQDLLIHGDYNTQAFIFECMEEFNTQFPLNRDGGR